MRKGVSNGPGGVESFYELFTFTKKYEFLMDLVELKGTKLLLLNIPSR